MRPRLRRLQETIRRRSTAPASTVSPEPEHPFAELAEIDRRDSELIRRVIAWSLAPGSCCIDVGAHGGSVLTEMVRVAPRGRHIAYEPLPHLAEYLRTTFPDVDVRCAAVSDHEGEESFARVRAAEAWSGLVFRPLPGNVEPDVEEIAVRVEALDDALPADFVPALVKIDVEGGEEGVLRGALRTLREHRPTVIFEHGYGAANAYGTEPDDVYGLLVDDAGLRVFDLDGDGPYSLAEFRRAYFSSERVNWVAHA
ncbi:MAG TPA: FkbM family methyltransferase [Thermoleophilaceae bacterium]|nr:FkbM family methyltransferase [Thermoleophilaceae bacterium]